MEGITRGGTWKGQRAKVHGRERRGELNARDNEGRYMDGSTRGGTCKGQRGDVHGVVERRTGPGHGSVAL